MEPEAGVIEVALRQIELAGDSPLAQQLTAGTYLELAVADTGPGIAPEILSRIFDPYYTTKDVGKGTGLGLAMVHGIVARMGGLINVDSSLGHGTRFTVLLPAVAMLTEQENAMEHESARHTGHILVVDDEPTNLQLMSQMLRKLGCEVTCAASAMEAWALLNANPARYAALITDHSMPQVKGLQLGRMVREAQLKLPVILYSGFGDTIDETTLAGAGIALGLTKPLSLADLARGLSTVLNVTREA
jgi:CheY-like chemotaxis protein